MAYLHAANVGTTAYAMLTMGNANLVLAHGSAAQGKAFAEPELQGRYFGTMCLSEPQAGSSLSDINTRADYDGESAHGPRYRVSGNKMWISGGDHELSENIVHLVLAKIPGPDGKLIPGVKGISLLLVPKFLVNEDGTLGERNDVQLAGVNHKMGYRGTVNCLLNSARHALPAGREGVAPSATGGATHTADWLHVPHDERGPHRRGLGAVALATPATCMRLTTRGSDRRAAPSATRARILQRSSASSATPTSRMLCAEVLLEVAWHSTLLRQAGRQVRVSADPEIVRADPVTRHHTPIARSWPSQWCLAANDLAIQVHGGYGYTREYKVEQFYATPPQPITKAPRHPGPDLLAVRW